MHTDSPNILLIMTDQHSPRQLGAYGDPLIRTPNLDRLADQGMRFDNTYCASPLCVPSRMSFMTGRLPSRTGMMLNQSILPSGTPTWAHHLAIAGYETSLIGRMHFEGPDQRHGFVNRPIGETSARHPGASEQGGPRYTKLPQATAGQNRQVFEHAGCGPSFYQHQDRVVTDHACEYLHGHADADQPFAALVGYMLPHCPFVGPKDAFEYYYDKVELPDPGEEPPCIRRMYKDRNLMTPPATEHQLRVAIAAYYAMCEYIDEQIGRVLGAVDDAGLADNTVVIYCSDHGEMAGQHGLWAKKCFYEEAARVPMIARWPGVTPAGSTQPTICNLYDLAPTLCEIGRHEPHDFDGQSLLPQLHGETDTDRETLSEVVDTGNQRDIRHVGRMIRRGPWKLWQHTQPDGETYPPALYHVDTDPHERTNLGEAPEHAATRDDLLAALNAGWDPVGLLPGLAQQCRDYKTLTAWGRTVQPASDDAFVHPGPELEEQIELRSLKSST